MTLFSDEQLAQGIQDGRAEDLSALVERHHAPLLGFLYRLTGGDRALAEDLVQETFLRVLANIGSYRPARLFKPWLYAIAVNLARDHYKQAEFRRTEAMPDRLDPPMTFTPESEILAVQKAEQVKTAMNSLPALQREAILLRYLHEFSLLEMAQALHVPVGTVKSRLSLGLKRLKEKLKAEG
jgi:RNA polymerase sigma-70 factor, ECF subfamily